MSLILAWVAFPLLLAALGAGWGALVQRAADVPVGGVLLIPIGLAAMIVVAGFLTNFEPTARAAVPVVAVGGVAGVVWARRSLLRLNRWPLLAALGVLLAYGAPVLLSGSATFLGYIRLDDTGSFLNIVDHVMFHARSVSGETPSTYTLNFTGDVGNSYPLGAFMLLGIGHGLTGIDAAWIVQPYLACCGAAVGLGAYALVEPLVRSPRICALIAFIAASRPCSTATPPGGATRSWRPRSCWCWARPDRAGNRHPPRRPAGAAAAGRRGRRADPDAGRRRRRICGAGPGRLDRGLGPARSGSQAGHPGARPRAVERGDRAAVAARAAHRVELFGRKMRGCSKAGT